MSEPYLRVHKINKTFKGVKALTDVDMEAHKSEVLGLAGINGAGKSTLMNVLAGIVIPEEGDIYLNGEKIRIRDPHDAVRHGIGIIHQEAAMDISNVMLVVDGKATRVGFEVKDGKKVRVAKATGKVID